MKRFSRTARIVAVADLAKEKHVMNGANKVAAVLTAVAGLAMGQQAAAQRGGGGWDAPLNWNNVAGGLASTVTNWAPNALPAAADDLTFNLAGNYAVTFNVSTTTSRTHTFRQGVVALNMSSPHTTTNGVTIGLVSGDNPVVTLSSGTWTSSLNTATSFDLGDVAGAIGTLNVTDDSADLLLPGNGARVRVGVGGTGTLGISGGGRVECGDGIIVGSNTGSTGTLTVSGAQAVSPFQRSTLLCVDATGVSHFGSSGSATVTISNGALVDIASFLDVSEASASTSTVTVGGSGGIGGILDATLDVGGDLRIGANNVAVAAGTGTVTVNSNGQVLVGGTLNVGDDPNGGSGTLNINTGGLVQATNVIDGSFGTINHTGGTLRIDGGTYTGHADPLVVTATGGPTLHLTSGLSKTLAPVGAVGLIVGDDLGAGTWTGTLLIDGGADLLLSGASKDIQIGDDTGTTGTIIVSGAGSRLVATDPGDDIRVGVNGIGTLLVEGGGQVLARQILVPATALNGDGTLGTGASGSPVITTVNLAVGNSVGGPGDVVLNDTAVLNATDPGIGVVVRTTGVLGVATGALLNATGTVLVDGGVLRVNGTVQAGALVDVASGGLLVSNINASGTPLVDAPVRVRAGGVLEAIVDDFTVGDAASVTGFLIDDGGTMRVGAGRTLTLLDSTGIAMSGTADYQGGTISFSQVDGITYQANSTLTGFGILDHNALLTGGTYTATGSGLVFLGEVITNPGATVTGTASRFASGSKLRPFDALPAANFATQFTLDAGAIIEPQLGNQGLPIFLSVGNGAAAGVTLNGVIHMGTTGILTLNDSNGVGLGTLTDMNGGTLSSVNGATVNNGRVLRGKGFVTVTNAALTVFGTIDPDTRNPISGLYEDIGRFVVSGAYTQGVNSNYQCDLAGFDSEFLPLRDQISASGVITLNGALDISFVLGYPGVGSHTFDVIIGSSRVGTFSSVTSPPTTFGPAHILYLPDRARVVLCYANCDGSNGTPVLTGNDFLCFINAYASGQSYANCDGSTGTPALTGNDFQCFINKYAASCQ